ncbi:excinuclease ABC subunit UvrA [Opitutales bacterium ASA1]|uniref:excinuclease ABC subunit UvrA n=1 Tax=Congregicoccus parvus TaxID=3081749 RepID=UPI002B316386|nr:excinuclease ABC subunit UvrA [Opitutales bacterium ASA1]
MPATDSGFIHVKGAREHNLKNLEVRIPRGRLVVITGVSGSGKSSLAFDTIYAEGYRKYMESLSTQARQVLEQLKRPDVDFIHGLSPVLAIEQRTAGGSPRSTIATVTEIADYARLLWTLDGVAFCPKDGGRIVQQTLDQNVEKLLALAPGTRLVLLAPWMQARPSVLRDEIESLRLRGFQRLRVDGELKSIDDRELIPSGTREVVVDLVIDRIVVGPDQRSRLADSLELAFREGRDRAMALHQPTSASAWSELPLNRNLACEICGDVHEPLGPRSFSFNTTEGACPDCGGLGRRMAFAEELIVPDPDKSVRGGAIKPLRIGGKTLVIRHNALLKQLAEQLPFDAETPWKKLPEETRRQILHGAGERVFSFRARRGKGEVRPFPGVMEILDKARRDSRSDGYRARLTAYQASCDCPTCGGRRLHPRSAAVRVHGSTLPDFLAGDVSAGLRFAESLPGEAAAGTARGEVVAGIRQRLEFLDRVGLGYLTLDREYSTLSGGEAQRVRLATQLGMGLVGVVYVLDEPSIGLHPSDNRNLLRTLVELRDRGNSVLVVEHDEETMLAADEILELGPGAGDAGGRLLFQGTPDEIRDLARSRSRTGAFLARIDTVTRDSVLRPPDDRWLTVRGARQHNLRDVDASFPVGLFTCVTGVSGSGKSTLVNDILAAAAARKLNGAMVVPGAHRSIAGLDEFEKVVRVDQEPIGRSPRSNPATFTKLFDLLRDLFARCPLAKVRGYKPNRFSFNVRGGRCEQCQGDGVIKLDMMFMSDAYTECPSCHGRRYNRETLEVRFAGRNIADVLDMTVTEARTLFRNIPRVMEKLDTLHAVGLGYLRLGQPANTLSGGEAQRLKLSLELSRRQQGGVLYILDEPTTGLHWADIQHLLDLLYKLRDAGNTIVVIEHNLDVVNLADWVIDLGPGGGGAGGRLVYAGPTEGLAACRESLTGGALREWRTRASATVAR